ncbi:hypothetical protein FSP39_005259 [Pinctada imbricata]|uniref:Solute carrier family 25 member 46 n=1 Tax=Pinctada imbricata TaxID=66713 RepID=A0AA88Y7M6_PINIB|nr:hypothetical protein FSP39_005259 [Pinctada imbricata]
MSDRTFRRPRENRGSPRYKDDSFVIPQTPTNIGAIPKQKTGMPQSRMVPYHILHPGPCPSQPGETPDVETDYNREKAPCNGFTTLWKGLLSVLLSKGILMVNETVISEFTPLPKEINRHSSIRKHGEHLLLKGLSFIFATPFLASSLIETVQAEVSSEKPGAFDFIKEGVHRVMGWGMPQTTRLLPIYSLVLPTAIFGVSHYVISQIARYTVMSSIQLEEQEKRDTSTSVDGIEQKKSMFDTLFPEMLANFIGNMLADGMLYPLETVLHRLYIQGTRTIIDNTDTGTDVIPISTSYEGVFDCFRGIVVEEGMSGFYKGFGALILQYAIQAAILRLSKYLFEKISQELYPEKPSNQHRQSNPNIMVRFNDLK